jgi:dUTP pyrophosphatase
MDVKFKKLSNTAKPPERAHSSDAGFDLFCSGFNYPPSIDSLLFVEANTSIALEIPEGYVGLIFPRSSISNTRHIMRNSVGVIDSGYRGEIKLRFSVDDSDTKYKIGNKIGQIVFVKLPQINLVESSELSSSERASGGFGSTGS